MRKLNTVDTNFDALVAIRDHGTLDLEATTIVAVAALLEGEPIYLQHSLGAQLMFNRAAREPAER